MGKRSFVLPFTSFQGVLGVLSGLKKNKTQKYRRLACVGLVLVFLWSSIIYLVGPVLSIIILAFPYLQFMDILYKEADHSSYIRFYRVLRRRKYYH